MTIIAAWITKEAAVSIVKARVDAGHYCLAKDNDVVWLHPNASGNHVEESVYEATPEKAIELYATTVGQFLGYDWARQQQTQACPRLAQSSNAC